MKTVGHIRKMRVELGPPVQYSLPIGDELIAMNEHIGQQMSLTYSGGIHCIACGRKTNKSFNQGYCFPCLRSLAECDLCIVRPEQCHFAQGTCRDEQWGQAHCMQPHIVYLANSSGIKVGITRKTQIPTRWIDQGAVQALPIFEVKSRFTSGLLEVILKRHVSDRTDWRKMLKGIAQPVDLIAQRQQLLSVCEKEISELQQNVAYVDIVPLENQSVVSVDFPVREYPEKVKSLNFDKTPEINGLLLGIKGQYLILDSGVLNMRKFAGYRIGLEV